MLLLVKPSWSQLAAYKHGTGRFQSQLVAESRKNDMLYNGLIGQVLTKPLQDECGPAQEVACLVAVHIPLVATAALLPLRSPFYG